MERTLKQAEELDPGFDYAGPDRCLGLLYRDAPGWPLSLGSAKKARKHLERALERSPDYPENHLNWVESCLLWNDPKNVARGIERLSALWPKARAGFVGESWQIGWLDWEKRWQTVLRWAADKDRSSQTSGPGKAAPSLASPKQPAKPTLGLPPPDNPRQRYPLITPVLAPIGKVVSVNSQLRFCVLDFSLTSLPKLEQQLSVYRDNRKVGELKVSGPTQGRNAVADIVAGEASAGDEVRAD
jgi:hypothetical protein